MTREPAPPSAQPGGSPRLLRLLITVAVVVWLIDQGSKWLAVNRLQDAAPVQVLGDWLVLTFLRNPGAAFSLGSGTTVLFTVVAVLVVVVILRTARRLRSIWWAIALGGLLGGALGNLTDRLFREPGFPAGHVVDFISVKYFAVFNAADMAIVGSAILMVLLSVLGVELSGARHSRDAASGQPEPDISQANGGRP